jgi:hypothetical protein
MLSALMTPKLTDQTKPARPWLLTQRTQANTPQGQALNKMALALNFTAKVL